MTLNLATELLGAVQLRSHGAEISEPGFVFTKVLARSWLGGLHGLLEVLR